MFWTKSKPAHQLNPEDVTALHSGEQLEIHMKSDEQAKHLEDFIQLINNDNRTDETFLEKGVKPPLWNRPDFSDTQ